MNKKYEQLMDTYPLGKGLTLRNRLVMSPMHTWSSNDDFTVSNEELAYYQERSAGVGLLITGCVPVDNRGIGFTGQMAAFSDEYMSSLSDLAKATKKGGATSILQIFHAGNKAVQEIIPNGDIVSSSSVKTPSSAFAPSVTPRQLTEKEIYEIIKAFGETTRRAIEAGFDGVEIHGAHGFLLQNFTSPYFNQRNDQWGGSIENRLKFSTEVVREIQNVIKEHATRPFIVGYRLSPDEEQEDGLRMTDTYELIEQLIKEGIGYIHASLINALEARPFHEDKEKTYLELIVKSVDRRVPLVAAGSIQTANDALMAFERGLPLIAIGHGLVINPDWVEKVQNGNENEIENSLKKSKIEHLKIPAKLWNVIEASGTWFSIEE